MNRGRLTLAKLCGVRDAEEIPVVRVLPEPPLALLPLDGGSEPSSGGDPCGCDAE